MRGGQLRRRIPCDSTAIATSPSYRVDTMFKHILVPVDGSAIATQAARSAIRFAQAVKARLTVIHVIHVYPYAGFGEGFAEGLSQYLAAANAAAAAAIAGVRAEIEAANLPFESRIAESNTVWRGIVEAAESAGADLIVMGTHGRGKIDRALLGSVTQRVLAHSPVPVMVVHGD